MDFVSRLKEFIDFLGMANSQFADTAQIPRPSLSQILNGRNKKISNEFIAKIHEAFPQLNVMWLMFGDGDMVTDSSVQFSGSQNGRNSFNSTSQSSNNDEYTPSTEAKLHLTNSSPFREPAHIPESKQSEREDNSRSGIRLDSVSQQRPSNPASQYKSGAMQAPHVSDAFYTPTPGGLPTEDAYGRRDESTQWRGHSSGNRPNETLSTHRDVSQPDTYTANQQSGKASQTDEIPFSPNLAVDISKKVASIMVFYTDNSFEIFRPSERSE